MAQFATTGVGYAISCIFNPRNSQMAAVVVVLISSLLAGTLLTVSWGLGMTSPYHLCTDVCSSLVINMYSVQPFILFYDKGWSNCAKIPLNIGCQTVPQFHWTFGWQTVPKFHWTLIVKLCQNSIKHWLPNCAKIPLNIGCQTVTKFH